MKGAVLFREAFWGWLRPPEAIFPEHHPLLDHLNGCQTPSTEGAFVDSVLPNAMLVKGSSGFEVGVAAPALVSVPSKFHDLRIPLTRASSSDSSARNALTVDSMWAIWACVGVNFTMKSFRSSGSLGS